MTVRAILLSIFLICLSSQAHSHSESHNVSIPAAFAPTSGVSIVESENGYLTVFYRGPKFQLIQAELSEDGIASDFQDLGGTLLSAPSAPSRDEVAYVGVGFRVYTRSRRSSGWSREHFRYLRSEHAPHFAYVEDGDDSVARLVVAGLNNRVQFRTRINGKWNSTTRTSEYNLGATDGFYRRNAHNRIVEFGSVRNDLPRVTSKICYSDFLEGGEILASRDMDGRLVLFDRFPVEFQGTGDWGPRGPNEQIWMSGNLDCTLVFPCVNVVLPQGNRLVLFKECT